MALMDAEWVTYRDLVSSSASRSKPATGTMELTGWLGRAAGAFPAKIVADPAWLADPLSIAVLNTALAVAVLWAGGFWEPLT
jgi:hypothetical protein